MALIDRPQPHVIDLDAPAPRPSVPAPPTPAEQAAAVEAVRARHRAASRRLLRQRLLLMLLCVVITLLGVRQIGEHSRTADRFPLDRVTLTADPVAVVSTVSGVVEDVPVRPGQLVSRGQVLMTVQADVPGGTGTVEHEIVAPAEGRLSDLAVQAGSRLVISQVAARLYQPERSYFRAVVPSRDLPDLEVGMTGVVEAGSRVSIPVQMSRIEPRLSGDPSPDETSVLVLVPEQVTAVAGLVPGLGFQGYLTRSSSRGR